MLKLFYKALNAPHLKEILKDIQSICSELKLDFFVVGALARNIWYVQNQEHSRGTKDIDFGIYISSRNLY